MKSNEAECSNCGKIDNKAFMKDIDTGRKVQWMCMMCYKQGTRNVQVRAMDSCRRIKREKLKK